MSTAMQEGSLPVDLTSFVGRRAELAEAKRMFGESRILTLTGTGGVGKTRLAIRLGHELRRAVRDGVWLVDLASQSDPGLVAETIATAIGLRDDTGRWSLATVAKYPGDRRPPPTTFPHTSRPQPATTSW
jgi:predicted ATPase